MVRVYRVSAWLFRIYQSQWAASCVDRAYQHAAVHGDPPKRLVSTGRGPSVSHWPLVCPRACRAAAPLSHTRTSIPC
eukprot:scaffold3119_cov105-Isochrysis_galbana.AAC.1